MRFLAVHPGPLMYTKIFLRLEPLGLEVIAEAARRAGHDVRLIDLQVESHEDYFNLIEEWQPDAVAFSCNYLANVPEIVDLSKATKAKLKNCFVFVGGHSASFTADEFIEHGDGAIDCVLRGEGEAAIADLLAAAQDGGVTDVPGAVTVDGKGPAPRFVENLDDLRPARDLVRHRSKYFIGLLDPCASVEFSRGCPWDCNFCSAWTFYGRSYRTVSPEIAVEEVKRIKEPGIFIVDDVAFIQGRHGEEIGEAIARAGIKKEYYLETRADVLLRNRDVFSFWAKLGVKYMFLGIEAIDEAGLEKFRKRTTMDENFEALEFARSLGINTAINIIADPNWDEKQFEVTRTFIKEIPEIVNMSVTTPYPGTEIWRTEAEKLTTRDYRLFDIQHAVVPTKLPLEQFYAELVKTQQVMNKKHLGWQGMKNFAPVVASRLIRGQTNFFKMLWKFNSVYSVDLLMADHAQEVKYEIAPPPPQDKDFNKLDLYVHEARGRKSRAIDDDTESFVDQTRMGATV